ncbi:MAG: hypothetical protein EOO52_13410 [Gammaproteobacteria bacterium]|nr:MAG: hypothetical protein EOO52_13410 [Gammaproteobacteria bacterium]
MLRFIATLLCIYFAFRFGAIWDSQANPLIDVTVQLQNGTALQGSLSYTWAGDNAITTRDGRVYIYEESALSHMSYTIGEMLPIWKHWRGFMPPLLIALALLTFIIKRDIPELRNSFRRNANVTPL